MTYIKLSFRETRMGASDKYYILFNNQTLTLNQAKALGLIKQIYTSSRANKTHWFIIYKVLNTNIQILWISISNKGNVSKLILPIERFAISTEDALAYLLVNKQT